MQAQSKHCLFRITKSDREKLERLIFQRYPAKEWGSFFRFGFRRTFWGLAASFVGAERPRPGDLDRSSRITVFRSKYILRAHHIVEDSPLAAGVIHSHPQGCNTFPSSLDDDMDEYYAKEFGRYGKGRPYASLIFSRASDGFFRFTGRVYDRGQWYPVTDLLTVGDELQREQAQILSEEDEPNEVETRAGETTIARLETLLGRAASRRLSNSKIGIIGCSGTGSPVAELLARAGIRRFVVVDPQYFAPSNLERMHGSRFADATGKSPLTKVEIAARHIREINPDAEVICVQGNILDEIVLDALLECDLLMSCTDSQHGRAALGDIAAHYLVPSVDVAVTMRATRGKLKVQLVEICQHAPFLPCPFCLGRINQQELSYELMSDEEKKWRSAAAAEARAQGIDGAQYWGDELPQELTVGYITTIAGSFAAGYAQHWLTGAAKMPHHCFQFDVGWTKLGVTPIERPRKGECSCGRTTGLSDQGRPDRSVSRPPHWPAPRFIGQFWGPKK